MLNDIIHYTLFKYEDSISLPALPLHYLFWLESCEAKHPDLVDDVLPVVGGAILFQTSHQLLSHLDDAVSHTMDLLQPGHKKQRNA